MTDRHFRVEATAAAPPAAVFGHLADIPNWRCWAGPFVPRSELARPGSVEAHGVGALRKLGSPPFWSIEEITGFSPPSLLAYELRSGLPLRGYRSTVTLTPLPSGGTHVGWESTFAAPPPARDGCSPRRCAGSWPDSPGGCVPTPIVCGWSPPGMIRAHPGVDHHVNVEIWSDIVCPWCYIGKRRFESALRRFAQRDEVKVIWRSFELDPSAPPVRRGDLPSHLAAKYGMDRQGALRAIDHMSAQAAGEGLEYHLDVARGGNTFDAHRLIHLGAAHGVQDAVKEAFLRAYHADGVPIGDRDAIASVAVSAGLDPTDVDAVLAGTSFGDAVRHDEAVAGEIGISGVPFFVFGRRYAVSGAQPSDLLLETLDRAWRDTAPLAVVGTVGDGDCADGSCAL